MDEITEAVLARHEVARYLEGSHGLSGPAARERVISYLEELRTTQRYELYRALEYPLYPILRKIERVGENTASAIDASARYRVVYASNHRSHIDYLVEPLVLDDAGIRPPIIAAGINLFGGALGLIHKHVTGALPIRRNTKDPAYLITLKAYVAELLRKHDLFFYPEGGRSYNGELKSSKTGLFIAALAAEVPNLAILPTAIAYDLVLEDHILARQATKRAQRPFRRELAEMVRFAVGYRSRAFVTFGRAIPVGGYDHSSRRAILDLAHHVRAEVGRLYKVLPTALMAAAMRPSITRPDLTARIDALLDTLRALGANVDVTSGEEAVDAAAEPFEARGIIVQDEGRFQHRAARAALLRAIDSAPALARRPDALMLDSTSKAFFHSLAQIQFLKRLASRYGMSPQGFARRFIAGESVEDAVAAVSGIASQGLFLTLDYLGESVATTEEADAATREYIRILNTIVQSGIERNVSLKLTQLGLSVDRATAVDNLRRILAPATEHEFFVRIDMENSPFTDVTLQIFETLWGQGHRNIGVVLQSMLMRTPGDLVRMNRLGARVRLVKGAYMEPKTVAYQKKFQVDDAYVALMKQMLDEGTYPAIATHDPAMIAATKAHAAEKGYTKDRFEFQMLYGIRRDLQALLVSQGYRVRLYVPFGQQWFPYFMRRLGERPANVAFVLKGIYREK